MEYSNRFLADIVSLQNTNGDNPALGSGLFMACPLKLVSCEK